MITIQIKRHFERKELLKSNTIPEMYEPSELEEDILQYWINTLTIIREILGFKITVTDGLRLFNGGKSRSQHFYNEWWSLNGAVDIRPSDRNNSDQFVMLALVLAAHPEIKRVCYYVPSKRFPSGGFHCDCKGTEKVLFINEGEAISWQRVEEVAFISRVKEHSVDIKTV